MALRALACTRLHAPPSRTLTLYRALRRFAGPVLAYRLSFARRTAA